MRRLLVATCLLGLAMVAVRADDEKETPGKAFKSLEKEFLGKIGTKDAEVRKEVLNTYSKKFLEHAEKNPKDDTAFDALIYVLRMTVPSTDKDSVNNKAIASLQKSHTKNPNVLKYLTVFANRGDQAGTDFLVAVMKDNSDKKVQAKACQAIMKMHEDAVKLADRIKENEALKKAYENFRGKDYVKSVLDNVEKNEKEAKKYSKILDDKYAEYVVNLAEGKKAPEVVSQDLDGKKVKLSDLKGKVVVLDIWATWCGPCKSMIPHTKKLVEKMKGKPFVFISVSADAKKETLVDFIKETPMPWTHWWNGQTGGIVTDWAVEAYPTIYVIDDKGIIRKKIVGADSGAVDKAVEPLVKAIEDKTKEK